MPADSLNCALSPGQEDSVVSICDNDFAKSGNRKGNDEIPQGALRDLCWSVGTHFPSSLNQEGIVFLAVNPHLGFIQWHINEVSAGQLNELNNKEFDHGSKLVVRIYDITDVIFNGFNARSQYDVNIKWSFRVLLP